MTVQLVDSASEEHVWAARYERQLGDVLTLQSDIVTAIAQAIELQLTPSEERARLAQRRPVNPEAYEAYLKGRFHWYKLSREHYETALKYFQLALEKDPTLAPAHAGIAAIWQMRGDSGIMPAVDAWPKANEALSKALALDPGRAEVHEIAGNGKFLYEWDWAGAEFELRTAIHLNPNYADARLFLSDLLISTKRFDEARAEMACALDLDPLSSFIHCFNGWHLIYVGHCDEAIPVLETVRESEPNFSSAHLGLWGAWYRERAFPEALACAKSFFAAIGDAEIEAVLGSVHSEREYRESMTCAARTLEDRARRMYVPAIRVARLYAHASDADRACEWLEVAYERRDTPLIHLAVGWDWHELRSDGRFERLIQRMNLPL